MKQFDLYDKLFYETLSEYFLALRSSTGKTSEDVALDLGIKQSTFYHYEKGLRAVPISVIKAVCEYYGKDFLEVFQYISKRTDEKFNAVVPLYMDKVEVQDLTRAELIKKINELEKQLKGNK